MAGTPWSDKEVAFLKREYLKGTSVFDIARSLKRTTEAVRIKCRNMELYRKVGVTDEPTLIEQVASDREIAALRGQLTTLRGKYKHALKRANWTDQLMEYAQDHIKALPPVPPPQARKRTKKVTTEEAVLLLSDIHYGEIVDGGQMRGLNEYNADIAIARLQALTEIVCSIASDKMAGYQFDKLHILMLGDMVGGMIHEEIRTNSHPSISKQAIDLSYIFTQMVRDFLTVFPIVEIDTVVGNHGRLEQKKSFKQHAENWDNIAYEFLARELRRQSRARITIHQAPQAYKKINGWTWLMMHGDGIRSWGGIPFYGIMRAQGRLKDLRAAEMQITGGRSDVHYICMGHFHNYGELTTATGSLLLNGSVKGSDEYAQGLFVTSPPQQLFCGVHRKHGITHRWPILLIGRDVAGKRYVTGGDYAS